MEREKIPLPEGAGAQFIAPSDLTAILLEPFYYDWNYETDGRIPLWLAYKYKLSAGNASCLGEPPFLVYGEEWVGKEIRHFPWCKELLEFLDCLKKQYGWTIAESWGPIVYSLTAELARERGVSLEDIRGSQKSLALRGRFDLAFSGYVWKGNLWHVDSCGCFWSATEFSADDAGFF
ncbi:MAG: hypothetical protein Q4F61_01085, partial [Candidatus Saccharibacteria bacterium]|nr:hypothetical protein [Candidatus Saccharibacteria bacterium]